MFDKIQYPFVIKNIVGSIYRLEAPTTHAVENWHIT